MVEFVKILPEFLKDALPDEIREIARKELYKLDVEIDNPTLIIVMDACRYDVFQDVEDEWLEDKPIKQGYTDAKWTIPSHESLLRGSIPNNQKFVPEDIWLNDYYKSATPLSIQHEYSFGVTAVPYLSESKYISYPFHQYFDDYKCFENHQSAEEVKNKAIKYIEEAESDFFGLLNFGETHHPWDLPTDEAEELLKECNESDEAHQKAKERQREGAEKIISKVKEIEKKAPKGTQIILTADHGALFKEKKGHKEKLPKKKNMFHEKLFEVPVVHWQVK